MANLQQIANCLMKTTQGNTAVIKQATNLLQSYSKDQNFIKILLSIPLMEGVSKQLARIATIYTLTYARNLVLWRNQSAINIAAQCMLQFVSNNTIDFKYKDQITAALQYLIQKDQNYVIVMAFVPNMADIFNTIINSQPAQINYQFIALMSQALVDKVAPATGNDIQKYIQVSFVGLCCVLNRLLKYMDMLVQKTEQIMQKALAIITKILKVFKKYVRKFMYFDSKLVQTLYSPHFITMLTSILNLDLPQNKLQIPIFYINQNIKISKKLLQYFHASKSLIVFILTQSYRVLLSTNNTNNNLQNSQIIKQCPSFINGFVNGVMKLLQLTPYYKINNKTIFKIIQQIYIFFGAILRSGRFYNQMYEIRPLVIYSCIFKTLAFCPEDFQNYYHNPQQFVNSLFQIVQLDANKLASNQKYQISQQIDIQIFDTLKTYSAHLIVLYVQYIDSTLSELVHYTINVIDDVINLEGSKNLMFVILCILRDSMKQRNDFLQKIKVLVFKNLKDLEIPTSKVQQPYSNQMNNTLDIQYTMTLFTLNRFIISFDSITGQTNLIEKSFLIAQQLLKNKRVQKSPKIIASQIIITLLETEQSSFYSRRTINLLMQILTTSTLSTRYLQCIQKIIKQNDYVFENQYTVLVTMLEKISMFLNNQFTNKNKDNKIVQKIWHIFQEISSSSKLGTLLAPTLRRVIQPFINLIDGDNELQLQQNIYKIMENIIKATGQVGQFQIQIITVLHKTFYKGKNKRSLASSFSLLQLILMHGKQAITGHIIVIQNLVLLAVQSINSQTVNQKPRLQTQCLEGVFILQSLIITAGQIFNTDIWMTIATCLANKLKNQLLIYDFVKATIISTLSLILSIGHKIFNNQNNEQLMKQILQQFHILAYSQPCKITFLSFCHLLQNYKLPFIINRFTQILDCTITLLKICNQLKPIILDQQQMDTQQKYYNNMLLKIKNIYENLDQYQHFKSIILTIKQVNKQILETAYLQLIETKQIFMKELLTMRKINNNVRVIYKLKNKNIGNYHHNNNSNQQM